MQWCLRGEIGFVFSFSLGQDNGIKKDTEATDFTDYTDFRITKRYKRCGIGSKGVEE